MLLVKFHYDHQFIPFFYVYNNQFIRFVDLFRLYLFTQLRLCIKQNTATRLKKINFTIYRSRIFQQSSHSFNGTEVFQSPSFRKFDHIQPFQYNCFLLKGVNDATDVNKVQD